MSDNTTFCQKRLNVLYGPTSTFYRKFTKSLRRAYGSPVTLDNHESWEAVQSYFEDRYNELEKALTKVSSDLVASFVERLDELMRTTGPVGVPERAYWRGIAEALEDEADSVRGAFLGE